MVTAWQEPHLVLVSITCEGERLILKAPGMDQLVHDCRLLGMDIKGRDCGDEAAQWFTSFLKTEAFRLLAYPDCSPIMALPEASLADLNTRLEKKVKMDQFRSNIVVTGCDTFEEDTWDELLIGNVEMKKILSCPRCILTTIDPDTGIIDRKEPLETLKSYPCVFYYSVEKIGRMQAGDPVYQMGP
ncbi:unnamed protein product [Nyctereutes procyonoides]|uniref:Mitochondrial amidoxime reducing component 2 n=1 Tax=Nyctereutes procyonoides TaxID=34880 RepID=A0A811ZFQ8_NYCPR|nr:unnamed protein product [Nyctereutes procyonoides]